MRKMCPRINDSNGFTIMEILVAVAIMGFISAVMVSLVTLGLKAQKQTNLDTQAHMIYRNLISLLNADGAWKVTMGNNPSMGCLIDTNGAGCAGSTAASAIQITSISDQDGKVYYHYAANEGYTNQGQVCYTYNGAVGQGNDQCPLHYDVSWWPVCGTAKPTCTDPSVHFKIIPTYNPSTKSTIPFNQLNYGTADYVRGSEAYACTFALDATAKYLTETCATVGIGTTASPAAELTIQQPTSIGIYAQEWTRGSNILNLDVAPFSVNGNAITFQGNAPILMTAQNSPTAYQLYLKKDGWIGLGNNAPVAPFDATSSINNEIGRFATSSGGNAWLGVQNGLTDVHLGIGALTPAAYVYSGNGKLFLGNDGNPSLYVDSTVYNKPFVGIGTAAPGSTLHVWSPTEGNILFGAGYDMAYDGGNDADFSFSNTSGAAGFTTFSGNGKLIMSMLNNGRVGIGTVTPAAKLEVLPDNYTSTGLPGNFTGGIHTKDISVDNSYLVALNGSQTVRIFNNPNNSQGEGRFTGALYARAFFYSSDERLKTNIEDLQDPLERVCSLRGVSFNWKSTGEKDMGFVAQEVKKTEPSLVAMQEPENKDSILSVKYGNIVALVVEAIKKIKLILFVQDQRILKLESENQELRTRLEKLEFNMQLNMQSNQTAHAKFTPSGTSH